MNLDYVVRSVAGRLSLRKLAAVPEAVAGLRDHQARSPGKLTAMVEALHAMFPKLSDFERDFPSLCFALATGGAAFTPVMPETACYYCLRMFDACIA